MTTQHDIDNARQIDTMQMALLEMKEKLQGLEKACQQLLDERDIHRLQTAYGYYVDKAQWDEATDLFADDATLEINHRGVYVGKPRVRQYLHKLGSFKRGALFNHMQLQPLTTVADDGQTARARWRAIIQVAILDQIAFDAEGTYENEYVKQNGIWKISKLHFFTTFYFEKDKEWQNRIMGKIAEMPDFPPDRPASVDYEPYPGIFVPPYHYRNPVTGK